MPLRQGFILLMLLLSAILVRAQTGPQFLGITVNEEGVLLKGQAANISYPAITLYSSTNLQNWSEIARLNDGYNFRYQHFTDRPMEFFKFEVNEGYGWANQIAVYGDPLTSSGESQLPYIKFVIKIDNLDRVYFFGDYLFHYDFVAARLDPFRGIPRDAFEDITRYNNGRQLLLGNVLLPYEKPLEYGIQFESQDVLPLPLVKQAYEAVRRRVLENRTTNSAPLVAFYVPTFEQAQAAYTSEEFFRTNHIPVTSITRWSAQLDAYSKGMARGKLKWVAATNITSAYQRGDLLSTDILLTDGVPAEIPYVAGILTFSPGTHNSHVAILAGTYGVPFGYMGIPEEQGRISALIGKEVAFETVPAKTYSLPIVTLLEIPLNASAEVQSTLNAYAEAAAFEIQPYERAGMLFSKTDGLTPEDIKHFGGKASNYGFLRRSIPTNSYEAIAISFDLWDEFMQQPIGARTLREEIAFRLARQTNLNDIAAIAAELDGIRTLITKTARFSAAHKTAIINILSANEFVANRNIRFRSSTNVEDSENFTGAGLYDSYSGCLGDDLDADTRGPSGCDPTEDEERGVFRAIQKVYASFYNDNAYLVRRRNGIDERNVGMALLVHYSSPDDIEMANGVAIVHERFRAPNDLFGDYKLVTQKGAVSVANPEANVEPEVINGTYGNNFAWEYFQRGSDLVPVGTRVLNYDEYGILVGLLRNVSTAYALHSGKTEYALDFEYKKLAPGKVWIKQVRPIPLGDPDDRFVPVLLAQVRELCSPHRINLDAFKAHRLKSVWTLNSKTMLITTNTLREGLIDSLAVTKAGHESVYRYNGPVSGLNPSVVYSDNSVRLIWASETADGPVEFTFEILLHANLQPTRAEPLLLRLDWGSVNLYAKYNRPVPSIDWSGDLHQITEESVFMHPCQKPEFGAFPFTWNLKVTNATQTITMKVNYAMSGPDVYIGYPDVVGPLNSEIHGLISKPIILRGLYSQTFEGVHYPTGERFIFEPQLEEGIDSEIVEELRAKNIRMLLYTHPGRAAVLRAIGYDGTMREIATGVLE